MVGILVSFWDGLFSGAMLVSGRVVFPTETHPSRGVSVPGLEDDEEEALDQLRMLEEEMHDMCSVPCLIHPFYLIPSMGLVYLATFG